MLGFYLRMVNNMMYAYIDGDDIGLKIENSFMNNDEKNLKVINTEVKIIINAITEYLIDDGYEIIFDGADGIICRRSEVNLKKIQDFIRQNSCYLNFSIGVGSNLRDAYLALRYAKSSGKNIGAVFNDGFLLVK